MTTLEGLKSIETIASHMEWLYIIASLSIIIYFLICAFEVFFRKKKDGN